MSPFLEVWAGALYKALHKLTQYITNLVSLTNWALQVLIILRDMYWLWFRIILMKSRHSVGYLALPYQKYFVEDILYYTCLSIAILHHTLIVH